MTRKEWLLAWLLFCVVIALMAILTDLQRFARRQPHQFAYCFNGKFNLAYPCHENPFWSADL